MKRKKIFSQYFDYRKKSRIIFDLAVYLLILVFLTSCTSGLSLKSKKKNLDPNQVGTVEEGIYINTYYQCSFIPPSGWQHQFPEKEEDIIIFQLYNEPLNIKFKVDSIQNKTTLSDYVDKEDEKNKDLKQIKQNTVNIAGSDSIETDYIMTTSSNENIKMKKTFIPRGSNIYVFTLVTSNPNIFEDGCSKLYSVLDSFKFLTKDKSIDQVVESYKKKKEDINLSQEKPENQDMEISNTEEYIVHVVKKGETLSSITQLYLKEKNKVDQIAGYNGLKPPYNLSINDLIKIPRALIVKEPEQKKQPKSKRKAEQKKTEEKKSEEPLYEPK
jgi:hypothetical protein